MRMSPSNSFFILNEVGKGYPLGMDHFRHCVLPLEKGKRGGEKKKARGRRKSKRGRGNGGERERFEKEGGRKRKGDGDVRREEVMEREGDKMEG